MTTNADEVLLILVQTLSPSNYIEDNILGNCNRKWGDIFFIFKLSSQLADFAIYLVGKLHSSGMWTPGIG